MLLGWEAVEFLEFKLTLHWKLSHNLHCCHLSLWNETALWTASCSLHHDSFMLQVSSSVKRIKFDMISFATHSCLKNMTTSRGEKLGGIQFWQIGQFGTGSPSPIPHVLSYRFVQTTSESSDRATTNIADKNLHVSKCVKEARPPALMSQIEKNRHT